MNTCYICGHISPISPDKLLIVIPFIRIRNSFIDLVFANTESAFVKFRTQYWTLNRERKLHYREYCYTVYEYEAIVFHTINTTKHDFPFMFWRWSKHRYQIDLKLFITPTRQKVQVFLEKKTTRSEHKKHKKRKLYWQNERLPKKSLHLPTATMPDSTSPDISLAMLFTMSRPHICWYSWNTSRGTR